MKRVKKQLNVQPPKMFRPILWSLRWQDVDVNGDKDDIIVNAVNEGTLDHWRWLIKTYGKPTVRRVLKRHLVSEFHPESRNLAKLIFSVSQFRHALKRVH